LGVYVDGLTLVFFFFMLPHSLLLTSVVWWLVNVALISWYVVHLKKLRRTGNLVVTPEERRVVLRGMSNRSKRLSPLLVVSALGFFGAGFYNHIAFAFSGFVLLMAIAVLVRARLFRNSVHGPSD
jgi:Ca2+/Na+ antiporter